MIILYVLTFMISMLISSFIVKMMIPLSYKIVFLDRPLSLARKTHSKATPLLGGFGVYCSYVLSLLVLFSLTYFSEHLIKENFYFLYPYLVGSKTILSKLFIIHMCGFLVVLLGLKDDKDGVTPLTKICVVVLVTLALYYFDIHITLFLKNIIWQFTLTILTFLFLTNSFNLLDNMNGLSSGVAITCSLSLFMIAVITHQIFIAFYLIAFCGVLAGFFRYNFDRGQIFLGDSGALFIGYNLAVSLILESFYIPMKTNTSTLIIPFIIFMIPFYDTLSVIVIRVKNGVPIYKGDQNHFSHRLNKSGFSKELSVIIIICLSLIQGGIALFLMSIDWSISFVVFLSMFNLFMIYLIEFVLKRIGCSLKKKETSIS